MNRTELLGAIETEFGEEYLMTDTDGLGICWNCGFIQEGCEPDASYYKCYDCGKHLVFGIDETLIRLI